MRIMGSIVIAELLCLALVHWWPVDTNGPTYQDIYDASQETTIQAPVRTVQQSSPPPPPAPQVPIPVPNDEPIEEEEIEDFNNDLFSDAMDSLSVTPGVSGEGADEAMSNPQIGPSVLRIEEPTFRNESPEKADIYVEFLVNKEGGVEEAIVTKILLYDEDGNATIRGRTIDEEVISRTIKAALNWKFRPARHNGEPVRAYTTNIFTVDY